MYVHITFLCVCVSVCVHVHVCVCVCVCVRVRVCVHVTVRAVGHRCVRAVTGQSLSARQKGLKGAPLVCLHNLNQALIYRKTPLDSASHYRNIVYNNFIYVGIQVRSTSLSTR